MSISRIVATAGNEHAQKTHKDKTIVVVAKITDDTRFVYLNPSVFAQHC
jgi:ribosomal protein L18E